jgi:hypothetical protein
MKQALCEQLAKRLGMVGSDHDGEALNAARAADKLIKEHNLTWAEALSSNGSDNPLLLQRELAAVRRENQQLRAQLAARPSPFGQQSSENHALQAQWALDQRTIPLDTYELEFLVNIAGRPWPLTERQRSFFTRIMLKVRRLSGETPP